MKIILKSNSKDRWAIILQRNSQDRASITIENSRFYQIKIKCDILSKFHVKNIINATSSMYYARYWSWAIDLNLLINDSFLAENTELFYYTKWLESLINDLISSN